MWKLLEKIYFAVCVPDANFLSLWSTGHWKVEVTSMKDRAQGSVRKGYL